MLLKSHSTTTTSVQPSYSSPCHIPQRRTAPQLCHKPTSAASLATTNHQVAAQSTPAQRATTAGPAFSSRAARACLVTICLPLRLPLLLLLSLPPSVLFVLALVARTAGAVGGTGGRVARRGWTVGGRGWAVLGRGGRIARTGWAVAGRARGIGGRCWRVLGTGGRVLRRTGRVRGRCG